MNNVNLVGRPVADPKVIPGREGKNNVAKFTLAVDYGKDKTDFIPCVCFGRVADFAEKYVKKGKLEGISGSIHNEEYTGKDGVKHYTYSVWVELIG